MSQNIDIKYLIHIYKRFTVKINEYLNTISNLMDLKMFNNRSFFFTFIISKKFNTIHKSKLLFKNHTTTKTLCWTWLNVKLGLG